MRDQATVTLPPEHAAQVEGSENLYVRANRILVVDYYQAVFAQLLLAASLLLDGTESVAATTNFLMLGVVIDTPYYIAAPSLDPLQWFN